MSIYLANLVLTNLLLTGILVVQCMAIVLRGRADRSRNSPKFPLEG